MNEVSAVYLWQVYVGAGFQSGILSKKGRREGGIPLCSPLEWSPPSVPSRRGCHNTHQ